MNQFLLSDALIYSKILRTQYGQYTLMTMAFLMHVHVSVDSIFRNIGRTLTT